MLNSRKFQYASRAELMTPENLAIWDNLSIAVYAVDGTGTCVYMNKIQREVDGFADIEVVGKHITELYLPNDMLRVPTLECLRLGEPILRKAYAYRTVDNLVYNSVADFFPLFDQGRKDGVISFCVWGDNAEATLSPTPLAVTSGRGRPCEGGNYVGTRIFGDRPPAVEKASSEGGQTRYTFESIIGNDPALHSAVSDAKAAAKESVNVMIWGESGTGKELFAQAIHAASPRRRKPFVAVNCAAIPETLLEGLLFGTVKGAYTDASDKAGLFEKAHGGTILLDELNSMPLSLQAKLLRVLQEKRVRRVGSQTEKPIDVRIISVLNEAPLSAVEHGRLRNDLYYRLAVVGISVPSLRERRDDIPLLVSAFLQNNAPDVGVDNEVLQMFWNCRWRGNVRELQHVIEGSLVLLGDRKVITRDCLPKQFLEACPCQKENSEESMCPPLIGNTISDLYDYKDIRRDGFMPYKQILNGFEMRCICNVLRVTGGNVAKAARIMDVSATCLRYKMKQLGISDSDY